MPTLNAPFGFQPVFNRNGSAWNQQVRRYWIPSTDVNRYNIGDAVISLANSDANGVPGVVKATVGTETVRGVIVGVEPYGDPTVSLAGDALALEILYIPAMKTRNYYVYVVDDPDVVFMIQGDGTATNQIAANANKNASFTVANPTGNVPTSATVLNSGSIAVTQGLNLKLMGLAQVPNNGFGTYAIWLVTFNQHELQGNVAGI